MTGERTDKTRCCMHQPKVSRKRKHGSQDGTSIVLNGHGNVYGANDARGRESVQNIASDFAKSLARYNPTFGEWCERHYNKEPNVSKWSCPVTSVTKMTKAPLQQWTRQERHLWECSNVYLKMKGTKIGMSTTRWGDILTLICCLFCQETCPNPNAWDEGRADGMGGTD